MLLFRLPSFSGRYILGLTLTQVAGRPQLLWFVKESNIHLSLHMIDVNDAASFNAVDRSHQLCYIQAHAVSVYHSAERSFIHTLS